MKTILIPAAALALATAAYAVTPEDTWKAEIADANVAYSKRPHAILKIQDATYLGEGKSATLTGTPGKPGSYKWVNSTKAKGVLVASYRNGKPVLMHNGKPVADPLKAVQIEPHVDAQAFPTQVDAGVDGIRVFVYNQQHPAAKAFGGLAYFPYDASYIVKANFKPNPKLAGRTFRTSRGTDKQFFHAGDATFTLKGKTFTLPMFAGENDPKKITTLSAFFTDDLTGKQTYGAGRYIDIGDLGPFPPKTVTLDFNYAYNPNCARSPFYTCPLALDHIKLAVKAGEKDPHAKH